MKGLFKCEDGKNLFNCDKNLKSKKELAICATKVVAVVLVLTFGLNLLFNAIL
ncbi:MAG: hypothetical protein LBR24_00615 [Methanobrevibacter sp.]|jgi:hypothetical protein|nr:hypothetical protein [Methanobrevibacter sp.]